jgi:two-component system, NarL family, nitrate/nitrite response regulator NarL
MRVLLIDDHALFREGLVALLERRRVKVIAAVGDAEQGRLLIEEHQPDVVLLDLRMPGTNGNEFLRQLSREKPDLPVVILTTSAEQNDLAECLRNGARGYLLKDMEPDELMFALRAIERGDTVVAPGLTGALASIVKNGNSSEITETTSPFKALTRRELEILCHLSEGQSNKVIARHLNISDGTVKLHVKAILRKLKVHSRVEAAVMAVEKGVCRHAPDT